MFDTCVRAVRSVMSSSVAISLLECPFATSARTSRSRSVSGSRAGAPSRRLRIRLRQQPRDLRVEMDLAGVRAADRDGDVVGVGVLEQVAGRARPRARR